MPTPLTVLLVDRSPLVCDRLFRALDAIDGVSVAGKVHDAMQAIQIVAILAPDVVIMDPELHGRGGRLLFEDLRTRHPRTKLVVYTNDNSPSVRTRFLAAGAFACLDKSLEFDALQMLIVRLRE